MSKYVKVPSGEYKVTVAQGQRIVFDTNPNELEADGQQGKVVITGDLEVRGNQTTVQSEDMVVKDNVIVLNDGDTGPGITLDQSGLQINRGIGTTNDVFFVYDENTNGFVFRKGAVDSGPLVSIQTNSITTGGENLTINTGSNVISVTGTTNYEQNVTDDDDITNKKYVDDAITTAFATVFLAQIGDGVIAPSTVKVLDNETTGNSSVIEVKIDNNIVAEFHEDRLELTDIKISGTTIETTVSNEDLILSAPGAGSVIVRDTLEITSVPGLDTDLGDPLTFQPAFPTNGVKLYVSTEGTGNTGIYFANADSTRDELISNNRSLVYGMIF